MIKSTFLSIFIFFTVALLSCNTHTPEESSSAKESTLDSLLQTVTTDQYGMKKYVLAYLRKGPNRDRSKEEESELQKAHMQNIEKMAADGKLVLAGPFLDDGEVRGIYIFNVETIEEAEALTNTDPAIQAGSLVMELVPWYGSAAVQTINFMHNKLQTKSIVD